MQILMQVLPNLFLQNWNMWPPKYKKQKQKKKRAEYTTKLLLQGTVWWMLHSAVSLETKPTQYIILKLSGISAFMMHHLLTSFVPVHIFLSPTANWKPNNQNLVSFSFTPSAHTLWKSLQCNQWVSYFPLYSLSSILGGICDIPKERRSRLRAYLPPVQQPHISHDSQ